ncbi:MAG TPA: heparinase II/III family protein [Caulobacteraceae bacterium]|nr:heparinase II/III family protein [Caulobacteraceae bacterium]
MARAPQRLAIRPRDLRPADPARGARLMAGEFHFGGEAIEAQAGGDPWGRLAPSRHYAAQLHSFGWLRDLLALGDDGGREALRLWTEWRRAFGRSSGGYAWASLPLERRVFNLACAAPRLAPLVTDAEGATFVESLARQAKKLAESDGDPARAAERAVAAALVGAALDGKTGEALLGAGLKRLARLIPQAVLRDGVHASRSPERGLELLFDLLALDDALSQRGAPAPLEVSRGIDRLSAGLRFFVLGDGRLAAFHGGEGAAPRAVAAALALDEGAGEPARSTPYGAYHRLEGGGLQLVVDAGRPAEPIWSGEACAQLGGLAVVVEARRLILGSAWSAKAAEAKAELRGPAGGSCFHLGDGWPGVTLKPARGLADRLEGGPAEVKAERRQHGDGLWLDIAHGGWPGFGATRRLYLGMAAGDLRGEDTLTRVGRRHEGGELTIRFHLAPDVTAHLAADGKSALLRPGLGAAWRLRSDAEAMRLAPGLIYEDGAPQPIQVLMLTGLATDEGARVRWRLTRDEG